MPVDFTTVTVHFQCPLLRDWNSRGLHWNIQWTVHGSHPCSSALVTDTATAGVQWLYLKLLCKKRLTTGNQMFTKLLEEGKLYYRFGSSARPLPLPENQEGNQEAPRAQCNSGTGKPSQQLSQHGLLDAHHLLNILSPSTTWNWSQKMGPSLTLLRRTSGLPWPQELPAVAKAESTPEWWNKSHQDC